MFIHKHTILVLYETKSRFYLVGTNEKRLIYKILKIDRTNAEELNIVEDETEYSAVQVNDLLNMIDTGNKATGGLRRMGTVKAIVGFIKFLRGYYMYLVTSTRVVAEIAGHNLFSISETRLVALDPTQDRGSDEQRYLDIFSSVDLSKNFYFSNSYDITRTLQHNLTRGSKTTVYDPMFIWNYELLSVAFSDKIRYSNPWVIPLIHGFVCQNQLNVTGRRILITLIARRSRHFAGARFHKRGVSDEGFCANEVESEQIVLDASFSGGMGLSEYTSFVQHRGSIPLFWSQEVNNMAPKPPIHINSSDPFYSSTALHFDRMLERYNAPICILNLIKQIEQTPRESILLEGYGAAVTYLNQFLPPTRRMTYIAFDMSRASKNLDYDVIDTLTKISERYIAMTSFFSFIRGSHQLQSGIVRTNCIDCLDRTNAAQFVLGKVALAHQLHALRVIDRPELSLDCYAIKMLMEMYHDHGDIIALQYGGSALVNTMETYRRTNAWSSQSRDVIETLKRYYSNSFTDSEKQDSIDLFLGNFTVKPDSMELEYKKDFDLVSQKPQKSYRNWFNAANISPHAEESVQIEEFNRNFDEYYSTSRYTSLDTHYMYTVAAFRHSTTPYEKLFSSVRGDGDKSLKSSSTSVQQDEPAEEIYTSRPESETKKYAPNSSAGLATRAMKPSVKAEELKEYERYVAQFQTEEQFSMKPIEEDTDRYNLLFYSTYLKKYKDLAFARGTSIDQRDLKIYKNAIEIQRNPLSDSNVQVYEAYRRYLETGRYIVERPKD